MIRMALVCAAIFTGCAVPAPIATDTPLPPRAFPGVSEMPLEADVRYSSAPPFDIAFTFALPDDRWESAHLLGEFFDVMRFDVEGSRSPTRWVAWAHPETVIGATSEPADGLSPEEAAALTATKPGVESSDVVPVQFAGHEGVRADFHAQLPDTHIFGGPAGNFGLGPTHDARIGFFDVSGELVLVLVLAPPEDFEDAWEDAQPILESVRFQ
jgi:hypothetical protein